MIGNEKEIQELSKIEGFDNLEQYMDIIDSYIKTKKQLEDFILQTQRKMVENKNDKALLESCKLMLNRYRKQIESINRQIEKHNHKFEFYLNKYKNTYGINKTYDVLNCIYERQYYMMYENEFSEKHKEGKYIVNYFELKEKNNAHKITLKKLAQLEMKEYEEYRRVK